MITGAGGGWVEWDIGTAAGATFIANGATTAGPQAGQIYVYGGDGYATFIGKGGQGAGSEGGLIDLFSSPSSDQTVVSAEAGIDGGQGGRIVIEGKAKVDLVQFQLFGNGLLDLSAVKPTALTIGSLSGDGIVLLSGHNLKMGNNNLTTVFAGSIQEAGSVFKLGTGTVTLTGANSYTGGTTLGAGSFLVANTTGSGTGTGPISVTAGILGGTGVISGPTSIGTGAGAGAFLVPAASSNTQATLTIQSGLTFNSDATYTCTLKARKNKGVSDKVVAKGVTINNGAMITLSSQVKGQLTTGLTLTLLSNTSGTFSNLPDGGIVTIKGNHFQATYSGGDGNDLTLTVVP
jgi:autotransporter-associated beta strand protein